MDYIKRDIEKKILSLSNEYSAILLTGPRQVGKTTMLRHIASSDRNYVTLDDLEAMKLAKNDPAMFLKVYPSPVLIDEVQYAPELFRYIKIAIDNGAEPGSYWLTGSQSFQMMELARESLAGRVAVLSMPSLSQHEIYGKDNPEPFVPDFEKLKIRERMGSRTDMHGIYDRIWKGSMPGILSGKFTDSNIFYSSYIKTYIERDISNEINHLDKLVFQDFIRACACRVGQILNIHDVAKDIGVSDDTAKRWLTVLEKSEVVFYLRPYSNNLLKRTIKTPKLYFFDTGLVAHLTKYNSSEILANGAINGAILENYVISEIIKSYRSVAVECLLWYYRDKDGREIDLVMESGGRLFPIEIKRSINPPDSLTKSFRVLDKGSLERGTGAILCMREELSAIDADNLIVPIWTI